VKHRGVSEVIGGVIMLGIVASIAALVLTLGLSSIIDFQTFLIDVDVSENQLKESFIVEFVEFDIGTVNVLITVRNVGLNDITIDAISIVNFATQLSIAHEKPHLDVITGGAVIIQPKTRQTLTVATTCVDPLTIDVTDLCIGNPEADATTVKNYVITISTGRGNIYEIEAIPLRA